MGKTKTHKEFVKDVENKYGVGVYEFITEYTGSKNSITIKHLECKEVFPIKPDTLLNKKKTKPACPNCDPKFTIKLTQEEVENRYKEYGYTLISEYKNARSDIIAICPEGHEWKHTHTNFQKGERCFECKGSKKRELEDVKQVFIDNNFTPTFVEYSDNKEMLTFICNEHPEYGEQKCSLHNLERGLANCQVCYRNKFRGENSSLWKGGLTSISKALREIVYVNWTFPSLEKYNFTCVLSGDKSDLEVHHLSKNFNLIVKEALCTLNLNNKKKLNELTVEEQNDLRNLVLDLHREYGLGIPLRKDIHKKFHKLYGSRANTIEQFEEFRLRYINGEFADLLNDSKLIMK